MGAIPWGFSYAQGGETMPKKPLRPCSHPGCPNLCEGQFCEQHRVEERRKYDKYERSSDVNRKYGRAWKRIRDRYVAEHPLCEQCLVAIRPQVCLFGEMVNNALMTRAAEEVSRAEALIVLGASLHSPLCSQLLQYYTGTSLILVTDSEHYSDQQADQIVYGRCDEFLENLVSEYESRTNR